MNAFDEHVDRDKCAVAFVVNNGGIVADTLQRGCITQGEVCSQLVDEAKFAEFIQIGQRFGSLFLFHQC